MKLPFYLVLALLVSRVMVSAQVPQLINYQGRVAVAGVNRYSAGVMMLAEHRLPDASA